MIALSAKMAKADGIVTQDEVRAFQQIFAIPRGRRATSRASTVSADVAGFGPMPAAWRHSSAAPASRTAPCWRTCSTACSMSPERRAAARARRQFCTASPRSSRSMRSTTSRSSPATSTSAGRTPTWCSAWNAARASRMCASATHAGREQPPGPADRARRAAGIRGDRHHAAGCHQCGLRDPREGAAARMSGFAPNFEGYTHLMFLRYFF